MKKIKLLKKEGLKLGYSFILVLLFLKIFYYKESLITLLKVDLAIYYLFIFPAFLILLNLMKKIPFLPRLLLSLGLGIGIESILVYYFNILFNIPIFPYYLLFPIIVILVSLIYFIKKGKYN